MVRVIYMEHVSYIWLVIKYSWTRMSYPHFARDDGDHRQCNYGGEVHDEAI